MTFRRPIRAALILVGLMLAAACSANNGNPAPTPATGAASSGPATSTGGAATPATATSTHFTEGAQYVRIPQPAGQPGPTGPVEVIEAFSYACPHCAEFAPYMDKLREALPQDVSVRYMPVVFGPQWAPSAQAFYAARELGVLDKTHDAVFAAAREHYPLNSLQDLANFYARQGVDREKFLAAATSDATRRQMAADQQAEIAWGVHATPTLVVGRRASDTKDAPFVALMRSNEVTSFEELQQLGMWMARKADAR